MNNRTNRYCTNCGAEVPAGADFCPNCGQAISQEEAPGQEQPPRAVPPTQEAPTQQAPPSPGPTAQHPAFQPPGGGATAAPAGPRRGLILGGIAAAAVGFLILVVVVALAAFLFWPRGGEAQPPDGGGGGGGGAGPTGGGGEVSCLEGSLSDLVQTQVGEFELDEDSVEEAPGLIEQGAAEALQMNYTKQDGSGAYHFLSAFPSADGANASMQEGVNYFADNGFEIREEGPLEDAETGEQLGSYALVEGETEEGGPLLIMFWTNSCVGAVVGGDGNNPVDFYQSSSY